MWINLINRIMLTSNQPFPKMSIAYSNENAESALMTKVSFFCTKYNDTAAIGLVYRRLHNVEKVVRLKVTNTSKKKNTTISTSELDNLR